MMPDLKQAEMDAVEHTRRLQAGQIQAGTSYHRFPKAPEYRPLDPDACPSFGGLQQSNLQALAAACPRDCIFNETMSEETAALYTCADGPCKLCRYPAEQFGDGCVSNANTCTTTVENFRTDPTAMACFLKYTFHEIHDLIEMDEFFGYVSDACNNVWPENEFESAPLAADDPTVPSYALPLAFTQTGAMAKVVKVRGECSIDNVLDNEADAKLLFEGAMPWSITGEDLIASLIAVTDAGGVALKEASAMMESRLNEEIGEGLVPEAEGLLINDKMATVFESKQGSCSEGHECSDEELAATSVPPLAAIYAFINEVGGPSGVITSTIEASLDTSAFGSSECLISCAPWDVTGEYGTCAPVDYAEIGQDMKAFQAKQFQLSSFMYSVGKDMVLESLCGMDTTHRALRGRSLQPSRSNNRQLMGSSYYYYYYYYYYPACDGIMELCLFQDGCGVFENITCGQGECNEGTCLPFDDFTCDDLMSNFEAAADGCSTLVVIDGLKEGFDCLHKFVDDMYGDCAHVPGADMEECAHALTLGKEIIHAFEHSIEVLKTDASLLVNKMMATMAMNPDMFGKMQERILELAMPIWLDHETGVDLASASSLIADSDIPVAMDMCDPMLSFGRATDIQWDQDCMLFESIMCLSIDETNVTFVATEEGSLAMFFCARAYTAFYPQDDGLFSTCLTESAANAGGPMACIIEEIDPLVAEYLQKGKDAIADDTIVSPSGNDQTHNLEDAMYTATMDPAEVIDANVEATTYTLLRRLHEKKQQRRLQTEEDCINLNGQMYCTKDTTTTQSVLQSLPKVPASNGKITKAHKYFTRKNKARKLHRAHKHFMRKHRQLSRRK
jgi:hypothetical protein